MREVRTRRKSLSRLLRNVDPAALLVGFQHAVGDDLGHEAVVEAWDGIALVADRADKLPHQVVAKHRRGLTLFGIARAVLRFQKLGWHIDRSKVLTRFTDHD